MTFEDLGVHEVIVRALNEKGITSPTTIQEQSIPSILEGRDILGTSATGSGKTLAFGMGILHYTNPGEGLQALVLTPTRELAEQVKNSILEFAKYAPLKVISVYGGVSINKQFEELRDAEVVVGTPGRILDHLGRRSIDFGCVHTLVLDECDQMLDMGFREDVEEIISHCPKERQTLFFTATLSSEISHLAQDHMHDFVRVSAQKHVEPAKLTQVYYDIDDRQKYSLLVHLLREDKDALSMIFCNSQRTVDFVAQNLEMEGLPAAAIHGGLSQPKRSRVLKDFHEGKIRIMVCTDVAARGIDITGVSHIYNFDIPGDSKQYVHRIGRTARASAEGKAINLVGGKDHENFSRVLHFNDVKIEFSETPEFKRMKLHYVPGRNEGNRGGRGHGDNRRSEERRSSRRW